MNSAFSLRTRQENGGTVVLQEWGAKLTDIDPFYLKMACLSLVFCRFK